MNSSGVFCDDEFKIWFHQVNLDKCRDQSFSEKLKNMSQHHHSDIGQLLNLPTRIGLLVDPWMILLNELLHGRQFLIKVIISPMGYTELISNTKNKLNNPQFMKTYHANLLLNAYQSSTKTTNI